MPDPEKLADPDGDGLEPIRVRRGRFGSLVLHEIEDGELTLLERGNSESTLLTFATALLSSAISFTVTLLTATVPSNRSFIVLITLTIVSYIAGAICLALWNKSRVSISEVVRKIRSRLPATGLEHHPNG